VHTKTRYGTRTTAADRPLHHPRSPHLPALDQHLAIISRHRNRPDGFRAGRSRRAAARHICGTKNNTATANNDRLVSGALARVSRAIWKIRRVRDLLISNTSDPPTSQVRCKLPARKARVWAPVSLDGRSSCARIARERARIWRCRRSWSGERPSGSGFSNGDHHATGNLNSIT
jgi:hypothetical protein